MPLVVNEIMEQKIRKGMEDIMWCAEKISEHFEGEEKANLLANLQPGMVDLCLLDGRFSNFQNVGQKTKSHEGGDEPLTAIYERYEAEAEAQPVDPLVHPMLLKYKKKVQELTGGGGDSDEDMVITSSEVNTIDPFTMRQMVNPVKNKLCGHVYDKDSVMEILRHKRKHRCPVVGCPVKAFTNKDLEPDAEMARLLRLEAGGQSSRT